MIDQILHRWGELENLRDYGEFPYPHFVDFHTSYACNNHCVGCAYGTLHNGKIMEKEKHFALVEAMLQLKVRYFDFAGGGEPTMLPYLQELMQFIRDNGGYFGLITNGSRLDDAFIDFLCENATYVRISLEASNPSCYKTYKRVDEGMWERILHAAKRLAGGLDDFTLKFSVGNSLSGFMHYSDALLLALRLGVKQVTFKALRHPPEELSVEEKRYEAAILKELLMYYPPDIKVTAWIEEWEYDSIPQCWMTPMHTVFDVDGNMYICCYYYYRTEAMKLGNIFEGGTSLTDNFLNLWFSNVHKQKLAAVKRSDCAKVDCKFFYHHTAYDAAVKKGGIYLV